MKDYDERVECAFLFKGAIITPRTGRFEFYPDYGCYLQSGCVLRYHRRKQHERDQQLR